MKDFKGNSRRMGATAVLLSFAVSVSATVYYNVVDYGATPDDSSDDSQAIQNACIAAAGARVPGNPDYGGFISGGTVYFPKGTYRISSAITAQHCELKGGSTAHLLWTGQGCGENNGQVAFYLQGDCVVNGFVLSDSNPSGSLANGSVSNPYHPNVTWFVSKSNDAFPANITLPTPRASIPSIRGLTTPKSQSPIVVWQAGQPP